MARLAVAIFHGIGCQGRKFADGMIHQLQRRLVGAIGGDSLSLPNFCFQPIEWGDVLQPCEDELCKRLGLSANAPWHSVRRWMVDRLGDAIAYEPSHNHRQWYDSIRGSIARQLGELACTAGPESPLCVIAHSFGSIVAYNYFRDQQIELAPSTEVSKLPEETALAAGHTLAQVITLGSPLGLWSIRHPTESVPLELPARQLAERYPALHGLWLNIYGTSDVLGFSLEALNMAPAGAVIDAPIRLGGLLTGWNPLSHGNYWRDHVVLDSVAASLRHLALSLNEVAPPAFQGCSTVISDDESFSR